MIGREIRGQGVEVDVLRARDVRSVRPYEVAVLGSAIHFGQWRREAVQAVTGFLGPNRAGKTTTLRMIGRLLRPTAGDVQLFGVDAAHPRARARLDYLPVDPAFLPHLTGHANLDLLAGLRRSGAVPDRAVAAAALDLSEPDPPDGDPRRAAGGLGDRAGRRARVRGRRGARRLAAGCGHVRRLGGCPVPGGPAVLLAGVRRPGRGVRRVRACPQPRQCPRRHGGAVVAGSYMPNLVALPGEPLAFVRQLNPFGYYSRREVFRDSGFAERTTYVGPVTEISLDTALDRVTLRQISARGQQAIVRPMLRNPGQD